jgi:hypothetical protein
MKRPRKIEITPQIVLNAGKAELVCPAHVQPFNVNRLSLESSHVCSFGKRC